MKGVRKWGVGVLAAGHGILILEAAHRLGFAGRTLINLPAMGVLALCALMDIQRKAIPDWLTLPGLAWVLVAGAFLGLSRSTDALLGALACGGILFIFALLARGSIGGGDVKLMAVIGASLGWQWGFTVLILSQVAAAIVAVCLLLTGRKERKDVLPFGPFIATFAQLALFLKPM